MWLVTLFLLHTFASIFKNDVPVQDTYWNERDKIMKTEESLALGSSLQLNSEEEQVNSILMGNKFRELDEAYTNLNLFPPARHFFNSRSDIEQSKVFKFIQKMPKGGCLHIHEHQSVSADFLVKLTYLKHLYACTVQNRLRLNFFLEPVVDTTCDWKLVALLRRNNVPFDDWIRSQFTLEVPNPWEVYNDTNAVWSSFRSISDTLIDFLRYKPVLERYLYRALEELYVDKVMYVEVSTRLPIMYDLSDKVYSTLDTAKLFKETFDKFKKMHLAFQGARIVFQGNTNTLSKDIETAYKVKESFPDLFAGFGISGQAELRMPLKKFIPQFKKASKDFKFFFHAGETVWNGASSDLDILDAVLLGADRISHGYSISKHPVISSMVRKRRIAIEVCPISNQVLGLVKDIRNHPATGLIARQFPIVIGSDNPSYWGVSGLSYDFYYAFVGMTGRNVDLRFLKQLALNSYLYSSLNDDQKKEAINQWIGLWNEFIKESLEMHYECIDY